VRSTSTGGRGNLAPIGKVTDMYVRWNKKERGWGRRKNDFLYAVLVESRRIDGKPRQKIIAYLASIEEKDIKKDPFRREIFWKAVTKNIESLSLSPEIREKIEESIMQRVSRPTENELKRYCEKSTGKA
jgi:hypothetical protein